VFDRPAINRSQSAFAATVSTGQPVAEVDYVMPGMSRSVSETVHVSAAGKSGEIAGPWVGAVSNGDGFGHCWEETTSSV